MIRRWERRSPIVVMIVFAVWYLAWGPPPPKQATAEPHAVAVKVEVPTDPWSAVEVMTPKEVKKAAEAALRAKGLK